MTPGIVFSYSSRGIGKRGQKKGLNLHGVGGISLRQPPPSANPFSKPRSDKTPFKQAQNKAWGPKAHYLVSPDFLPPARCDFSHARKGKWPLSRVFLWKCRFPFLAWENRISREVENRGSLISVPLALREDAIEAAILNRVLDRDWTLPHRGPLSVLPTLGIG